MVTNNHFDGLGNEDTQAQKKVDETTSKCKLCVSERTSKWCNDKRMCLPIQEMTADVGSNLGREDASGEGTGNPLQHSNEKRLKQKLLSMELGFPGSTSSKEHACAGGIRRGGLRKMP